jgi:hypothetical protein
MKFFGVLIILVFSCCSLVHAEGASVWTQITQYSDDACSIRTGYFVDLSGVSNILNKNNK